MGLAFAELEQDRIAVGVDDVGASLKGEILARLPDEPLLVMRAINEGVPIVQSAPGSSLAAEINKLAQSLTWGGEGHEEADGTPLMMSSGAEKRLSRWMRPTTRKKAS